MFLKVLKVYVYSFDDFRADFVTEHIVSHVFLTSVSYHKNVLLKKENRAKQTVWYKNKSHLTHFTTSLKNYFDLSSIVAYWGLLHLSRFLQFLQTRPGRKEGIITKVPTALKRWKSRKKECHVLGTLKLEKIRKSSIIIC